MIKIDQYEKYSVTQIVVFNEYNNNCKCVSPFLERVCIWQSVNKDDSPNANDAINIWLI